MAVMSNYIDTQQRSLSVSLTTLPSSQPTRSSQAIETNLKIISRNHCSGAESEKLFISVLPDTKYSLTVNMRILILTTTSCWLQVGQIVVLTHLINSSINYVMDPGSLRDDFPLYRRIESTNGLFTLGLI